MPCICDQSEATCELIARRQRGGDAYERIRCLTCGRTFRRVWIHR